MISSRTTISLGEPTKGEDHREEPQNTRSQEQAMGATEGQVEGIEKRFKLP